MRATRGAVRILFITSTRIGDAVLSTGLLDHLIRVYPHAKVVVACGPVAEGVFARMPNLAHFASIGFPFARHADLSETVVVLPNPPAPRVDPWRRTSGMHKVRHRRQLAIVLDNKVVSAPVINSRIDERGDMRREAAGIPGRVARMRAQQGDERPAMRP